MVFLPLTEVPHSLLCGDTFNRKTFRKESVDLIITSPPYNVGKTYNDNQHDDRMDYKDHLTFTMQRTLIITCILRGFF